jgi:Toprim domain
MTRPDAGEIRQMLAERVDELVPALLPAARRIGAYWQAGNVAGDPGGSLYVHRASAKIGKWTDAATGEFGDLLDLVNAALFGGQELRRAMEWARDWLRLDPERPPPSTPAQADRPKPHQATGDEAKMAVARNLWAASQPPAGTLAEAYLVNRSITVQLPPTLRYHPALLHHATAVALPALIAAISGPGGKVTAIQRTFLDLRGRKAPVIDAKMSLGCMLDGTIRLAPAGEVLGLAEGLETALSAMQIHHILVWAACGCRFDRVAIPDTVRQLIVFGDNGEAGHCAAEKAEIAHAKPGRRFEARFPAFDVKDWNDVLQAIAKGEAA